MITQMSTDINKEEIICESEPGVGIKFKRLSPIEKRMDRMIKRILVIDDDEAIRKLFLLTLEETPYQVDIAKSGEEGIELEQRAKYDLIFLDLKMPGLNGVETLRELRQIDPGVPIYIVTAFHKEFLDQLGSVAEDGLNFEIVHKPIGADEINLLARSVLEGPVGFPQ